MDFDSIPLPAGYPSEKTGTLCEGELTLINYFGGVEEVA